ncbi:hypothetical protein QE152_g1770 [Popillia japonica]|uniref:Uncharacterized protein n=1 Tax=Popillia japonica TaxID=7064 RepID=A0AAW1N7Z5_POPJA
MGKSGVEIRKKISVSLVADSLKAMGKSGVEIRKKISVSLVADFVEGNECLVKIFLRASQYKIAFKDEPDKRGAIDAIDAFCSSIAAGGKERRGAIDAIDAFCSSIAAGGRKEVKKG